VQGGDDFLSSVPSMKSRTDGRVAALSRVTATGREANACLDRCRLAHVVLCGSAEPRRCHRRGESTAWRPRRCRNISTLPSFWL
jgi:hypothetical protein